MNVPKNLKKGRNEPCYCGSEKKFKKCCWYKIYAIDNDIDKASPLVLKEITKAQRWISKKYNRLTKEIK